MIESDSFFKIKTTMSYLIHLIIRPMFLCELIFSMFFVQTGEQVKSMAQGAADAVKNTLGMGENNPTSKQ